MTTNVIDDYRILGPKGVRNACRRLAAEIATHREHEGWAGGYPEKSSRWRRSCGRLPTSRS